MYLAIVLMPLIGSIISGFFGRKVGVQGSQLLTCGLIILTTALAIIAFIEVGLTNTPVSICLTRWIDLEYLNVLLSFNFDCLTTLMLIPVLFVSSAVHVYSVGYMSHDPHNQRFFSYLSLFTFMMIVLVTANNYLLMFVGWEGVGICSYLLVSFWFTRIAANQSSIAAILTNRVGDCLLTIGMFAILWSLGNLDYATVFSLAPFINENVITIIGICLLIGAMAKSSQIGLHVWLPMAMEGPTPVSALIHAATMVTAGVYLLIRSSPLIEYSSTVLLLCLWVGAITTLFSSLIGLFQQDIKKVIAYSTMSQLGLMVVAVGLSSYNIALFHLINHAFYKALLFLGAGAVIHAVADKQDFRKYGGLKQSLPLSYSVMFIASLSLVAFPFMTGFFSKDFILESCYGKFNLSSIIVYFIATIGAMFTTLYSIKTLYLTFIANPNGSLVNYKNVHEGNIYMSFPLIILALFSIYFGFITKDMFIGLGSDLFRDNSVFMHPTREIMINTEFAVPVLFKLLPFILTIFLILISIITSEYLLKILLTFKFNIIGYTIFSFLNLRFSIELIYNKYITELIFKLGEHTTRTLDKGAIELVGPYGLKISTYYISRLLTSLDTGIVTSYAVYILIAGLTYISLPFILSSPYITLIVALLGITCSYIKKSILSIDIYITANDNNIMQSKINIKYYAIKLFRITIIAIIMYYLRNFLVLQFDLHREVLTDCIIIAYASAIADLLLESIWPVPTYHTLEGEQNTANKPFSLTTRGDENTNIPNSPSSSDNPENTGISRSPIPNPLLFYLNVSPEYDQPKPGEGLGMVGGPVDDEAFKNRDKYFAVTAGEKEDYLKLRTPMTPADLNDGLTTTYEEKYEKNGKPYGVLSEILRPNTEGQQRGLVAGINCSYVPSPDNTDPNNPAARIQAYAEKSEQAATALKEHQKSGNSKDAQGNDTEQTKQLTFDFLYYACKRRESFGIFRSQHHASLLRLKLDNAGINFNIPPAPENLSHDNPNPDFNIKPVSSK